MNPLLIATAQARRNELAVLVSTETKATLTLVLLFGGFGDGHCDRIGAG